MVSFSFDSFLTLDSVAEEDSLYCAATTTTIPQIGDIAVRAHPYTDRLIIYL
ncbi:hypothetical protein GCM10008090_11590 [Arenicella chitinivorans]|uniref:Uncharacterized protein n=1 Tax=Arenicella chitinivorans TaxID=1329800 RepID=A0A918RMA9_9GAMM|nr:hypothetical protein GCM10008090_11590 [Arenicella chitinivorans]